MKKVLALALALIMVLGMGVTSFAITTVESVASGPKTDWDFTWLEFEWDVNNENVLIMPYDFGDFAIVLDGTQIAWELFHEGGPEGDTLSSIKVETEKGLIDATVYKLDDYVKSIEYDSDDDSKVTGIKTKSSWPFDDFDLEDIIPKYHGYFDHFAFYGDDGDYSLDRYLVYFDFPTYGGAKVSFNNYVTLKFRENTTGADHIKTSKKLWFCVYPWAVDEDDVENYADEDEPMELAEGFPLIAYDFEHPWPLDAWDDDDFADAYDDVPEDHAFWCFWTVDPIKNGYWDQCGFDWDKWNDQWSEIPYVIEKSAWAEIIGSTLIIEVDDDLIIETKKIVKGQTGISFAFNTHVDGDVQALDKDAELVALNFVDTTNVLDCDFIITYTFEIEDVAKSGEYFLYELVGDELVLNQKVAVHKGDEEAEVEIKRKGGDTLGQYYLSDVELKKEETKTDTETETENPNTGASEVAGVAVALAVVSLISAAAVSLKK
ncbi:MAG TPA: hypothetical protein PKI76_07815 [Oscillospiraceae bacterium]|nr:hypothetical protein [Oscillospiraceae bacterium]